MPPYKGWSARYTISKAVTMLFVVRNGRLQGHVTQSPRPTPICHKEQ